MEKRYKEPNALYTMSGRTIIRTYYVHMAPLHAHSSVSHNEQVLFMISDIWNENSNISDTHSEQKET